MADSRTDPVHPPNDPARRANGSAGAGISVSLKVNGTPHALTLDPRTTILDLVREHLELTGTKKGCGQVLLARSDTTASTLVLSHLASIRHQSNGFTAPIWGPYCQPCRLGNTCKATGLMPRRFVSWASLSTAIVTATGGLINLSSVLSSR